MADNVEVVRVLKFETGDSVKSLADLKKYIKDAKETLSELEIGTEEYNEQLKDLQKAQDAMRDSMHMGVEGIVAQKGSYNDLVHTMRELKEQWRATTDESERANLGFQINEINNQLKNMDASVGVFSRNVGDYSNKMQEAMVAFGSKTGAAAAGGLKQFKLGLDAVSKTPVIAIIGIIVTVIEKLIKALKGSEDGLGKMTAAMGIASAISEGFTRTLQFLADGISGVVNWLAKLADNLGFVSDRMREKQALAEREIQLAKDQRAFLVEEAKMERDIAEDRATAVDRENKTYEERLAALDRVAKREKELMEERKRMAQEALDIYAAQIKATKNSADVEQKKAELQAAVYKAEAQYHETVRRNNRERLRIHREQASAHRAEAQAAKQAAKEMEQAAKAKINAEKAYLQELLNIVVEGSKTQFKIQNTIALKEKELAEAEARARIKNAEELSRELELIEQTFQLKLARNREAYNQKQIDAEALRMQNIRDGYSQGSQTYLNEQVAILEYQYETLTKLAGENDEQFLARRIAAFKALQAAREEASENEYNTELLRRQNDMALLEEGSIEYLERSLELKAYELDTIHQLEEESEEEFRARQLAAQKAYNDESRALMEARVSMMQTWAGNVSALATGIADAFEALAEDEEKAAEQTKILRIGAATIDTISGAIGAFMSAMHSGIPAPYNMILGAIQAATVTATGVANIAKLKATKVKGGSGSASFSSSAAVTPPPVIQQAQVTRTLTSASEEERLDKMASDQRVVLVYDDVKEAGRYVEVVQDEAAF